MYYTHNNHCYICITDNIIYLIFSLMLLQMRLSKAVRSCGKALYKQETT